MNALKPSILPLAIGAAILSFSHQGYAQEAKPPATTDHILPAIEVSGQRQTRQYHQQDAHGATRTDTPLREVPQSVRVIPRQLIDDVGAQRLDQSFDYVSGVSRQNSFGGMWDNFAVRGFAGHENTGMNFMVNGLAGNRGFNAPRDTANIERIEFLKGPAAALYGSSEPGGTLNIVTKKPKFKAEHAVEAYAGTHSFYRTTADSTGPLADGLAYRVNIAAEDRASFRDFADSRRQVFAPALTWVLGNATMLNYESELLRQKTPLDRGVVAVQGRLDAIPRSRFLGEPNDGDVTIDNQTHQLTLEHELSGQWRARAGIAYKDATFKGYSTESAALQADNATLRRQRRYRDYGSDDLSLQADLVGKFSTGAFAHELLAGVEAYRFHLDQTMLRVNPSATNPYAINIYNPVYGQPQPAPLPSIDTREEQRNSAVFMQDQVSLSEQWKLLAGVRFDSFEQRLDNRRTAASMRQKLTATSPRAGVTYLPTPGVSLYLTAGKSFRPNTGISVSGAAFDPERGRSIEAGIKWESADRRIGATAALFDIRKRNVLSADPVNTDFSIAAGEARSRGLDADLAGQLSDRWRLTASFAYTDAKITRDNTLPVGTPLPNVPKTSGSLLAVYEDGPAAGGRYGVGGGVMYVGKRSGDPLATFDLPSYATAKLLAYWEISNRLRLSLDIDNLFDKTYYANSYSNVWVTPGAARMVTLGVRAKF